MRPVTLNLASRPFRNNTLVGSALGIVGAALILASAYNLYIFLGYGSSYAQLQREQAEDRVKIASLQIEERRLVAEVRQRNFKKVFEQGKIASELIVRGAFSWTQLFNTLEAVVPPDVVMTAIRPNITTEGIVMRIEGVAKNHGALLSFETRLQQSPAFAKVFPENERRLNPSLPDITFLLTCDYLPQRPVATDRVAAAATKGEKAPAVAAAAPKQKPRALAAGVIVGREGEPRARRAAGSPVVAPGAVYVPAQEAPPAGKPARRPSKARGDAAPAAQPVPAPVRTPTKAPAETAKSAAAPVVPPAVPPAAPAGKNQSAPPVRVPPGPRGYDPNVPHTMPPEKQAAIAALSKAERKPVAAIRLDVPLTFVSRPVGEVYQNLAEAHGVRFDLDGSVDRNAPVTVNLRGRKLEDAILLVSGMARHKVQRVAEGVYKVSPDEGGKAITEQPISEEPIQEDGP